MISDTELDLGRALVEAGIMKEENLQSAISLVEAKKSPNLMVHLLQSEILSFNIFQKFLSENFKIKTAILASQKIPDELIQKVGWNAIETHLLVPIMEKSVNEISRMALGMVNPLDEESLRVIQEKVKAKVTPVLISLSDFNDFVEKFRPKEKVSARPQTSKQMSKALPKAEVASKFEHINNIKKYSEEIIVRLGLDPYEAEALNKDSYYPHELLPELKKIRENTLARTYSTLTMEEKFESLIHTLIIKGHMSQAELLETASLLKVFGSRK